MDSDAEDLVGPGIIGRRWFSNADGCRRSRAPNAGELKKAHALSAGRRRAARATKGASSPEKVIFGTRSPYYLRLSPVFQGLPRNRASYGACDA